MSEPPPEPAELAAQLQRKIVDALPGATAVVRAGGPGHFEVEVTAAEFAGLTRVQQQRRVYDAIGALMSGAGAPVHAIDKMVTRTKAAAAADHVVHHNAPPRRA